MLKRIAIVLISLIIFPLLFNFLPYPSTVEWNHGFIIISGIDNTSSLPNCFHIENLLSQQQMLNPVNDVHVFATSQQKNSSECTFGPVSIESLVKWISWLLTIELHNDYKAIARLFYHFEHRALFLDIDLKHLIESCQSSSLSNACKLIITKIMKNHIKTHSKRRFKREDYNLIRLSSFDNRFDDKKHGRDHLFELKRKSKIYGIKNHTQMEKPPGNVFRLRKNMKLTPKFKDILERYSRAKKVGLFSDTNSSLNNKEKSKGMTKRLKSYYRKMNLYQNIFSTESTTDAVHKHNYKDKILYFNKDFQSSDKSVSDFGLKTWAQKAETSNGSCASLETIIKREYDIKFRLNLDRMKTNCLQRTVHLYDSNFEILSRFLENSNSTEYFTLLFNDLLAIRNDLEYNLISLLVLKTEMQTLFFEIQNMRKDVQEKLHKSKNQTSFSCSPCLNTPVAHSEPPVVNKITENKYEAVPKLSTPNKITKQPTTINEAKVKLSAFSYVDGIPKINENIKRTINSFGKRFDPKWEPISDKPLVATRKNIHSNYSMQPLCFLCNIFNLVHENKTANLNLPFPSQMYVKNKSTVLMNGSNVIESNFRDIIDSAKHSILNLRN